MNFTDVVLNNSVALHGWDQKNLHVLSVIIHELNLTAG